MLYVQTSFQVALQKLLWWLYNDLILVKLPIRPMEEMRPTVGVTE
jgi:hypothetical protein